MTLTFNQTISRLTASNITLSGVSGITKGTISGSGPAYILPISDFTDGGTLNVAVASPPGYIVSGSPRTVTIYYAAQPAVFTLTFAQIADISITPIAGPTIYQSTANGPASRTITLDNSSQYTNITWRVTGTTITGTGASFTLTTAGDPVYNSPGQHFLTVEVTKAGIPYNKTIVFTVAP